MLKSLFTEPPNPQQVSLVAVHYIFRPYNLWLDINYFCIFCVYSMCVDVQLIQDQFLSVSCCLFLYPKDISCIEITVNKNVLNSPVKLKSDFGFLIAP